MRLTVNDLIPNVKDQAMADQAPTVADPVLSPVDPLPALAAMTPAQLDQLAAALWPLLWQRVQQQIRRGALS